MIGCVFGDPRITETQKGGKEDTLSIPFSEFLLRLATRAQRVRRYAEKAEVMNRMGEAESALHWTILAGKHASGMEQYLLNLEELQWLPEDIEAVDSLFSDASGSGPDTRES